MILGEVEETITTVEIDEETYEELFKVCDFIKGRFSLPENIMKLHGMV